MLGNTSKKKFIAQKLICFSTDTTHVRFLCARHTCGRATYASQSCFTRFEGGEAFNSLTDTGVTGTREAGVAETCETESHNGDTTATLMGAGDAKSSGSHAHTGLATSHGCMTPRSGEG